MTLLVLSSGCSTLTGVLGRTSNFTETVPIETGTSGVETAVVLATDLDYAPIGKNGTALLASMVQVFQEQYGSRLIWVDVGRATRTPELSTRLQGLGLRATATELDGGPVVLSAGRVRVGLIGLRKLDSLSPSSAKEKVGELSARARAQGAQVVVLVAESGFECGANPVSSSYRIHKPTDLHASCLTMDPRSRSRLNLLRALADSSAGGSSAQNGVDLILTGQPEPGNWKAGGQIRWIAGQNAAVPLIRPQGRAKGFALAFLYYDEKSRSALSDRARVEGLIPVCERLSESSGHCLPGSRGPWAKMRLRGRSVGISGEAAKALHYEIEHEEHHTQAAESERLGTLPSFPTPQKRLDFLADLLRLEAQADLAFVNSGTIQGELPSGNVTRATLRSLFDESPLPGIVTLNANELRQLARVLYNGAHDFPGVSGARLRVIDRPYDAPSSDMNGDSLIDYWEINRLMGLQINGKDVKESSPSSKRFRVALSGELLDGRDGLSWLATQMDFSDRTERLPIPFSEILARALQRPGLNADTDTRVSLDRPVKKATKRRTKRRK